jgi:hypothetical protein
VLALAVAACSSGDASPQTLSCQLSVGSSSGRSLVDLKAPVIAQTIRVRKWTATFSQVRLPQTHRLGVRVDVSGPGVEAGTWTEGGMPSKTVPFATSFHSPRYVVRTTCTPWIAYKA